MYSVSRELYYCSHSREIWNNICHWNLTYLLLYYALVENKIELKKKKSLHLLVVYIFISLEKIFFFNANLRMHDDVIRKKIMKQDINNILYYIYIINIKLMNFNIGKKNLFDNILMNLWTFSSLSKNFKYNSCLNCNK